MPVPAHRTAASRTLRPDRNMMVMRLGAPGGGGIWLFHWFDSGAFANRVAGVDGDLLSFLQPREHFDAVTVVAAQLDSREVDLAIRADDSHLGAFSANHQRVSGNQKRWALAQHLQIDLGEHARK